MADPHKEHIAAEKVMVDGVRTIEALEARTFGQRFMHFNPHFTLFRSGFALCIRSIVHLGDIPPKDDCDRALRDLACDSLDSLWLAEYALLRGYDNQSLLLLRRSYETTALMAYFVNFPEKVNEWKLGNRIEPSAVRKALATAPIPEPEEELRTMYKATVYSHMSTVRLSMRGSLVKEIVSHSAARGTYVKPLLGRTSVSYCPR